MKPKSKKYNNPDDNLAVEEQLRTSEEKYRALYNGAPLPYQSLDENGYFLDVNPAWLRTLGYELNEVIGENYSNFLHTDSRDHFKKNFPVFKAQGYIHDVEFKIRHKDGHFLDISFEGCIGYTSDGKFKQTYCVFQDITDQKKAVSELRKNQEILNTTEKLAKVGGWMWDKRTEKMFWTKETYRIYECDEIDFEQGSNNHIERGITCYEDKDQPLIMVAFKKCLEEGISYDLEFPFTTFKGKKLWIRTTAQAEVENNIIIAVFGNIMDITAKKKSEEELLKYQDKLELLITDRTKELEEKNKELERFNKLFVNREFRIKELRDRVKELEGTNNS